MDMLIIPKIAEMIEARKRKYDDFLQKAEVINKQALMSLQQYEDMLTAARTEANAKIAQNEEELSKLIATRKEEINLEINQKMKEQQEKLAAEKNDVLNKINELSVNLAFTIVKQLNLPSVTKQDIEDMLNNKDA
jgi:F0F1-type ATP synthase membrane subunit b/b'